MVTGFSVSVGDFWKIFYSQHLKTVASVCVFFLMGSTSKFSERKSLKRFLSRDTTEVWGQLSQLSHIVLLGSSVACGPAILNGVSLFS